MPERVRALRGATTLDEDTGEQVLDRTAALLREMLERNGISRGDIVSIVFTATEDVQSEFPAAAARRLGLDEVPLLCARELAVADGMTLCVRVLMHFYTERGPDDLRHVFLERASSLPTDLPR
jgi:chorismate mutase